jgi:hypothetical protein
MEKIYVLEQNGFFLKMNYMDADAEFTKDIFKCNRYTSLERAQEILDLLYANGVTHDLKPRAVEFSYKLL